MSDLFDELKADLKGEMEGWLSTSASSRFDDDELESWMDRMPSLAAFERLVQGMGLDEARDALVSEITLAAKSRVRQTLLEGGTKWVRSFFRGELHRPGLFDPDQFVIKPVIYELDVDVLIPLRHLEVREAVRAELDRIKPDRDDLDLREEKLTRAQKAIEDGHVPDGTFGQTGALVYEQIIEDVG